MRILGAIPSVDLEACRAKGRGKENVEGSSRATACMELLFAPLLSASSSPINA